MSAENSSNFTDRIVRALKLEVNLYEEVEADTSATGQAMAVVVLSSLAAGIGNILNGGLWGVIGGTVAALLGWVIWATLIYLIGTKLLPEEQTESSVGELLRTLGFASAPGLLRVFTVVPFFGWFLAVAISIWMLIATVIAVRQALDYESTGRAVAVCFIGWVVQVAFMLAFMIFGAVLLGFAGLISE